MIKYDKNKISHRILVVIASYIALIFTTLLMLNRYECPINKLIGMNCPTCGITRAAASLLKLDFIGAWQLNPLIYLLIVYIVLITIEYIAGKLKNSHLIFYGVSFMALAILNWGILIFAR